MEIVLALITAITVFVAVMAVDAWLTGRNRKGPGHWFQQHWFWQIVREAKWLLAKKPPEQRVIVHRAEETEGMPHG